MEKDFISSELDKKLDLIFAEDSAKLLKNVREHLQRQNMQPVSLNIVREHNSFCAVVVGEVIS